MLRLPQAGDQRVIRIELENPLTDRDLLSRSPVEPREGGGDSEGVGDQAGRRIRQAGGEPYP